MSSYSHSLNVWGVLSQSKRIINAHSRHFLALSVSFLLPLSFSLIIFPSLHSNSTIFHPHPIHLSTHNPSRPDPVPILGSTIFHPHSTQLFSTSTYPTRPDPLPILGYTVFAALLSLLAVATITYSTFHGFYGRPVKLVSSFSSVLETFLPLLATFIVSRVIQAFVVLLFALFAVIVVQFVQFLGFELSYDSHCFVGLVVFVGVLVVSIFVWLEVVWSLSYVIVVVESKWGFESLRRSVYLVKGMRRVALSVLVFFGVVIGLLVGGCSCFLATVGGVSGGWMTSFGVVLQMVVSSGFATLLMLQSIAASVVLYMYCKALHGELALDIAEEFAREYVYLPFDNEKVPHVVCVVQE